MSNTSAALVSTQAVSPPGLASGLAASKSIDVVSPLKRAVARMLGRLSASRFPIGAVVFPAGDELART